MVPLHVVLGKDKRMADISELLHERATVAHTRTDAARGEQFLYCALYIRLCIACPVVE